MKIFTWFALAALAVSLSGCAAALTSAPFAPAPGGIITSVKAPLTINFESTPVCEKRGTSSSSYFLLPCYPPGLWSFAWDNCSIEEAKVNGGLKTIHYADYEILNILGIWQTTTVIAYGE